MLWIQSRRRAQPENFNQQGMKSNCLQLSDVKIVHFNRNVVLFRLVLRSSSEASIRNAKESFESPINASMWSWMFEAKWKLQSSNGRFEQPMNISRQQNTLWHTNKRCVWFFSLSNQVNLCVTRETTLRNLAWHLKQYANVCARLLEPTIIKRLEPTRC